MKRVDLPEKSLPMGIMLAMSFIRSQCRKQQLPLVIFIMLCLNLLIAPVVYAAAGGILEKRSTWAIGVLGFVTAALVIYLFIVVFQPERF
ncbi:potassium-dependent ATPase G chain [Cylindrospermum sp. NIES-4074]|nr:potassium-dependent ATPase G chain [Cylindrospermum sp. NIES-4074]